MLANPRRMSRHNRLLRRLSIALLLLIALSNLAVLVLLVRSLVIGEARVGGQLLGAGQVLLTHVLVFALAYWEIDRGGPVSRACVRRTGLPAADFRFPQDGEALDPQTGVAVWTRKMLASSLSSLTCVAAAHGYSMTRPITDRPQWTLVVRMRRRQ
jgi:hypothetical protein